MASSSVEEHQGRADSSWYDRDDRPAHPPSSRLPKRKCADAESGWESSPHPGITYPKEPADGELRIDWSRDGSARKPLASYPGQELREEVVRENGQPVSWGRTVNKFRDWMQQSYDTSLVFQDVWSGDEVTVPALNRFMIEKRRELYAKLQDAARGTEEAYGDALHTVLLSFTASYGNANGGWFRPPIDHLTDLDGAWDSVRREISRVLEGRDFEYVRMWEPHATGYAHYHVAIFVRGPVDPTDFKPVLEAHVRNCDPAASDAHTVENVVEVRRGREVENLGAYLSSYLLKYGEEALAAPPEMQKFNALLWAANKRRWSSSEGLEEFMAFEPPPSDGDWELTHIEVDGERFPAFDAAASGIEMVAIEGEVGLDPPKNCD